jgi:hypothetical protein
MKVEKRIEVIRGLRLGKDRDSLQVMLLMYLDFSLLIKGRFILQASRIFFTPYGH